MQTARMVIATVATVALLGAAGAVAAAQPEALRIVVIEGEDAVNVIQQQTAVAPIVEVRDRNNQPVAGAVVTFSVRGGRLASFAGGSQTMTVTTNAAGRAAAGALNPLGSGTFQIQVQAAFQGQTAVAAIAQTNVLTAAEAAAAAAGSSSSGGGAGSAGTAGGSTGGVSGTTLGVIGAGIAGGALAATQLVGGDEAAAAGRTYAGAYSLQFVMTVTNDDGGSPCTHVVAYVGTLRMTVEDRNGAISGTASMAGTKSEVGPTTCGGQPPNGTFFNGTDGDIRVTGTPGAVAFERTTSGTSNNIALTETLAFSGALGQDSMAGSLTVSRRETGGQPVRRTGTGAATVPVTLR